MRPVEIEQMPDLLQIRRHVGGDASPARSELDCVDR